MDYFCHPVPNCFIHCNFTIAIYFYYPKWCLYFCHECLLAFWYCRSIPQASSRHLSLKNSNWKWFWTFWRPSLLLCCCFKFLCSPKIGKLQDLNIKFKKNKINILVMSLFVSRYWKWMSKKHIPPPMKNGVGKFLVKFFMKWVLIGFLDTPLTESLVWRQHCSTTEFQ